mgnify:CR=1 FL=1
MPNQIKASLLGLAVVVMVAICPSADATEARCASAADVDAFAIRDLQSRLMVAGLACGQRAPYNAFVAIHKSGLDRSARQLIEYFRANTGGVRALDAPVTRAANAASLRHGESQGAYCAQTAQLFRDLVGGSKRSLSQVARNAKLKSVTKPVACTAKAPTNADALVIVDSNSITE